MTIRDTPPPEPEPFATESPADLAKYRAALETSAGSITVEFFADKAPEHVRNFLRLASAGVFDGTAFHRVVRGFVIQTGALTSRGPLTEKQQKLVRSLQPEFNDTKHVKGILSMARGDDPASASTSFFIVTGDAPSLDGKYTVFGRVVEGMAVVEAIEQSPVSGEAPVQRIDLKSVRRRSNSNSAPSDPQSRNAAHGVKRPGAYMKSLRDSTACLQPLPPRLLLWPCRRSVSNRAVDDWPQWRGPNRDGRSAETGLLKDWPAGGPPLAWRATGAGEGYSSFATSQGRLFTLGARGGTEYVVAFDAASGKRLWETAHGTRFSNDRGDGPRATPTIEGDRVYAFGASGDLSVLDAASGKVHWTVNVLKQYRGSNIQWGLSESPLVLEDRILVNAGGTIVALKKTDGTVIWTTQGDEAGYSSAVLTKSGNVTEAIFFTSRRVLGVDVNSGRQLWSYGQVANNTANIATPIVRGNRVFVSSDYGTGAALLELTASGSNVTAKEVYFTRQMKNHHATSILVGEHLYGFDSAILTALKFDTGEVAWQNRSVGKGSLTFADDRLYLYSEGGVVGLAEASPKGYREHGRFELKTGRLPTWSHPVVSGGKLFLRDQDVIYAYDVRAK